MRRTMLDPAHEHDLVRDGFVEVPFLEADALLAFRERFERLRPADGFDPPGGTVTNPTTYHCTFLDVDREYKVAFDRLCRDAFPPLLDRLLDRCALLTTNCYAKQPGRGDFEVHQNWTLTTDPADLTVTVWVPLQDTTKESGTLAVIPGSHKLTRDIAYPRGDHYFSDYDRELAADLYVHLPVRAGSAVVFDDNLIHGSGPNLSGAPRFALQIAAVPVEATPVVWYPTDGATFDLLAAPGSFYTDTTLSEMASWPDRFPHVDRKPNENRRLPREEFAALLADGSAVRRELWGWDA